MNRERLALGSLLELSQQLVELCGEHGRLTVALAVSATGRSRNTYKVHIRFLSAADHLEQQGAGRGVWHSLK